MGIGRGTEVISMDQLVVTVVSQCIFIAFSCLKQPTTNANSGVVCTCEQKQIKWTVGEKKKQTEVLIGERH